MYTNWKISRSVPFLCIIFCSFGYSVSNKKLTENYIAGFKRIAVEEMRRTGIPASIKLAQGILESDLGRSPLAAEANNHFGIKCGGNWTGASYYKHDDDTDSTGMLVESCFRSYMTPEDSYRAHSDFLTAPEKQGRYGFLFKLGSTDYEGWANGLKFSGYASDPSYPKKLIRIIESYKLYLLDEQVSPATKDYAVITKVGDVPTTSLPDETKQRKHAEAGKIEAKSPANSNKADNKKTQRRYVVVKINGLKCVKAGGGEDLSSLAEAVGTDLYRIMEFNEECNAPGKILDTDEIIFLDRKKKTCETDAVHQVKNGESLYTISQMYGLRLETLRARNNLPADTEPLTGEYISLTKNLPKGKMPRFKDVVKNDRFMELGSIK